MPRRSAAFHASSVFFTFDTIRGHESHQTIRRMTSIVNANDSNRRSLPRIAKDCFAKATPLYIPIGDNCEIVTIWRGGERALQRAPFCGLRGAEGPAKGGRIEIERSPDGRPLVTTSFYLLRRGEEKL